MRDSWLSSPYGGLPDELMAITVPAFNREQCIALESVIEDSHGYELEKNLARNSMCITNSTHGGQSTCQVKHCFSTAVVQIVEANLNFCFRYLLTFQ